MILGPSVMLGYLSQVTADGRVTYAPCQAVHTGDLGYLDTEGNVHLIGRRDDLLNIHGNKIHPIEIESIAIEWPGVADARARVGNGPEPVLILEVVPDGPDPDLGGLRRLLHRRLPIHFVPGRISPVKAIARTELGSKTVRS